MQFDSIVLEGGGMYGFYQLGALSYLQENGYLNNLKVYSGSSVGALLCYMLIIGFSPIEILLYLLKNEITTKTKQTLNIKKILENKGIFDFSLIRNSLIDVTYQKIGKEITMSDIKKMFNKTLVICTFNYTKKVAEYITHETHPDMPCIDALQASCSIPFMFDWFDYDGYIYVDGGFVDNFPIANKNVTGNIIGITTKRKPLQQNSDAINTPNILMFMYDMFNYTRYKKVEEEKNIKNSYNIEIPIEKDLVGLSLGLMPHDILDMFSIGYNCSKNILKK